MFGSFGRLLTLVTLACAAMPTSAAVDEDRLGAWYMYFFNTKFSQGPWGLQRDAQYRNWDLGGDLEQLLLRGGLTYQPKSANLLLTLGYANVTSGAFGDSSATNGEDRSYQELLLPQTVGPRVNLRHRFRYEQRWVENQDFRTRFRYALFMDAPLNRPEIEAGTLYLAVYNEVFLNGERDIGAGREVEIFDRNRFHAGVRVKMLYWFRHCEMRLQVFLL